MCEKALRITYSTDLVLLSHSLCLTVFDVIFLAPAQFADRDQQISVRSGEKAILQCRAKGDLPIDIQWSNKHAKIGSHSNHRFGSKKSLNKLLP